MSKTTLEGWCKPISLTDHADHTFVYCPENKKYFRCWGSANIHNKDAERVCSKKYAKSYCIANNYREDIGKYKDTAGLGIYAVNGVCHQSANLFLYSAGTHLPCLSKSRPGGIIASYAMYGVYGTDTPGPNLISRATHFAGWKAQYFRPAKTKCQIKIKKTKELKTDSNNNLFQKINELHSSVSNRNILSAEDLIVHEFKIITKALVPELDTESFGAIHRSLLKAKDEILRSAIIFGDKPKEFKLPKGKKAEEVVERLNDVACEFQKSLAKSIGLLQYENLSGNKADKVFRIIDPIIAVENWSNY